MDTCSDSEFCPNSGGPPPPDLTELGRGGVRAQQDDHRTLPLPHTIYTFVRADSRVRGRTGLHQHRSSGPWEKEERGRAKEWPGEALRSEPCEPEAQQIPSVCLVREPLGDSDSVKRGTLAVHHTACRRPGRERRERKSHHGRLSEWSGLCLRYFDDFLIGGRALFYLVAVVQDIMVLG